MPITIVKWSLIGLALLALTAALVPPAVTWVEKRQARDPARARSLIATGASAESHRGGVFIAVWQCRARRTSYREPSRCGTFGRHAGALASVRPDDLLATEVRALVARNPFAADDYEDLIAGCTNQAGEDARNLGHHAALLAGLPPAVGGLTVNHLCGSGLAAVLDAARAVPCAAAKARCLSPAVPRA